MRGRVRERARGRVKEGREERVRDRGRERVDANVERAGGRQRAALRTLPGGHRAAIARVYGTCLPLREGSTEPMMDQRRVP